MKKIEKFVVSTDHFAFKIWMREKLNEIIDAVNELDELEARVSLLEAHHMESQKKEQEEPELKNCPLYFMDELLKCPFMRKRIYDEKDTYSDRGNNNCR